MYPDPRPSQVPLDPAPGPRRRMRPAYVAAIAAFSVAALGLMGLKFVTLPGPDAVEPGERLKIEVVAPVEPDPSPGSVMDVGELVDGFRYVPPEPAAQAPVHEVAWLEDEDFAPWPPPSGPAGPRRYTSSEADAAPTEPEPPRRERERRWFGFDNPLPDFGAVRRARQARLDALEDQRRAGFEDRAGRRQYYEERRDDRRYHRPPRDEPPADEPGDGPWGPEVG